MPAYIKVNRQKLGKSGVGAKKKKKPRPATGRPTGRPSDYREGYANLCRDMRMLGLGLERIAFLLNKHPGKLLEWRKNIPEFGRAWDEGGEHADAGVARSVYNRAMGYSHVAEKLVFNKDAGVWERTNFINHYPPDTTAGKFWLTNRQPQLWQDKTASELTGKDGQPLTAPPTLVFVPVEVRMVTVIDDKATPEHERIKTKDDDETAEWVAKEKGVSDAAD